MADHIHVTHDGAAIIRIHQITWSYFTAERRRQSGPVATRSHHFYIVTRGEGLQDITAQEPGRACHQYFGPGQMYKPL
jgi:hypothetical protein